MDGVCMKAGIIIMSGFSGGAKHVSALGCSSNGNKNGVSQDTCSTSATRFSFTQPLRSFWPSGVKANDRITFDKDVVENQQDEEIQKATTMESEPENWVFKILRIRSIWNQNKDRLQLELELGEECCNHDHHHHQAALKEFDRDSFSRLLHPVSLAEAKLYAHMCYLGSLAYSIPKIKPANLLKYHGLRYVTSSVDKKAESMKTEPLNQIQETKEEMAEDGNKSGYSTSAYTAYRIAALAASYVQSHTRSIILPKSPNRTEEGIQGNENAEITNSGSGVVSFVVTTNSLTAVVAAKEEMKQAVAKDFNSVHSSPCQWFICDDDQSGTRYFAIQGSDTLASWQANLLFEPIQFEGLDVLVHRGIYEAAKGIYEQIMPEIRNHLKSRGESATFRFTGHSLGGSLSLLINLMLIIRGEVPLSFVLPVITFGSPAIMCGGDQLLRRLGLPRNHVQSITMHRDIVPRAFSCSYPDPVIDILRAVNRNFRDHPCLKNQKLLYPHMGEILILQPDEKISPHHHLLPSGNGLYILSSPVSSDSKDPEKQLEAAQTVFLNSPHPLEILSDKSSYGSGGAIYRDHDMKVYLRSVRGVIRQELKRIRKVKRGRMWWPQGIRVGRQKALQLSGIFRRSRESLSRLVASHHMHLFMVLIFPVRLLLIGFHAVMSFH